MKRFPLIVGSVVWLFFLSTFANASLISLPDPEDGGPTGRYTFSWSGVIEGFPFDSLYDKFEDVKYTVSGFYFSNGTFDFTRIEIDLPPPEQGGPGSLVALPNPLGCGGGCLALPDPDTGGPGNFITLVPRFELTFPVSGGNPTTARFLSLDFNGTATTPSVTATSFKSAPVPEPSTICLFAAGFAGLAAYGRKKKHYFERT